MIRGTRITELIPLQYLTYTKVFLGNYKAESTTDPSPRLTN